MADKKISKLSKDEIDKEYSEFKATSLTQNNSNQNSESQSYIDKLKDKDIVDYFTPFGLVDFKKIKIAENDPFKALMVDCKNFTVILSDYDIIVSMHPETYNYDSNKQNSEFNIFDLFNYSSGIDTAPEKILADLIQIEFLGQRFHSYEKYYTKRKHKERKEAFDKLPKNMKHRLKVIDEKRRNEIDSIASKLQFGDFSGNQQS